MNRSQIKSLLPTAFLVALIGGCGTLIYKACGILPAYHSRQELISNYEKRKEAIIEAKNYFESIVPPEALVVIKFEKDKLGIFH